MQRVYCLYNMCIELFLNIIQTVAAVVASISVLFAFLAYRNSKIKDSRAAAIDQVSFFRKDIIPLHDNFINSVRETEDKNYIFSRIRLDRPTIENMIEDFKEDSKKQVELLKKENYLSKQTSILNMLEELALKIKHYETKKHPALNSIKTPFVMLVEISAVTLIYQREIVTGLPTYSTILEIYNEWKDLVDRRNPEERQKEVLDYLEGKKNKHA